MVFIATTHKYKAGFDKSVSLDIRSVFYAFFPQSKVKRQPGICDCFKNQNKCLLV